MVNENGKGLRYVCVAIIAQCNASYVICEFVGFGGLCPPLGGFNVVVGTKNYVSWVG